MRLLTDVSMVIAGVSSLCPAIVKLLPDSIWGPQMRGDAYKQERTCKWHDQMRHERISGDGSVRCVWQGDETSCGIRNYGSRRLGLRQCMVRADT